MSDELKDFGDADGCGGDCWRAIVEEGCAKVDWELYAVEGCCFDLADWWQLWKTVDFKLCFDGLLSFYSQLLLGFCGDGSNVTSVAIEGKLHFSKFEDLKI